MNTTERIRQLSENEEISISKIEKIIGASRGVLNKSIKNGTDIQSKWISKIVENFPQYNSLWLLTGKGTMLLKNDNASITNNHSGVAGINIAGAAGSDIEVNQGGDAIRNSELIEENKELKEKVIRLEKQIDKLFKMLDDK